MLILIVEDEAIVAAFLQSTLEDAGHATLGPAATEREALALAAPRKPDLALIDIALLDGDSGVSIARRLRERWNIPSLFVSGEVDVARANADCALGQVAKPYAPTTILQSLAIVEQLGRGVQPDRLPGGLELFSRQPGTMLH